MLTSTIVAGSLCATTVLVQIASTLAAALRMRVAPSRVPVPQYAPAVSLIRPVCGLENFSEETLGSAFRLDYPDYEIIFCVEHESDAIVPVVNRLIAAHPDVRARLIVGKDRISPNPKLNNIVKGWRAAAHDWIVIADSNVLMPRDYVQRLSATWQPDTGLVCSPPVGCLPDGIFAELECAFLNTYQARWQCVADSAGYGFAQGKSMLWRRDAARARRWHSRFGQRACRGRGIHQGGSEARPPRAHRRSPVPPAIGAPYGQRSVAPAAALGAAAA